MSRRESEAHFEMELQTARKRIKELEALLYSHSDDVVSVAFQRIKHLEAKERVLFDIYDALGIEWGDDPYAVIQRLKNASSPAQAPGDCDFSMGRGYCYTHKGKCPDVANAPEVRP